MITRIVLHIEDSPSRKKIICYEFQLHCSIKKIQPPILATQFWFGIHLQKQKYKSLHYVSQFSNTNEKISTRNNINVQIYKPTQIF